MSPPTRSNICILGRHGWRWGKFEGQRDSLAELCPTNPQNFNT